MRNLQRLHNTLIVGRNSSVNFLTYRAIKRLDISDSIHIEPDFLHALQFLTYYSTIHSGLAPEMIILDIDYLDYEFDELLKFLNDFQFANKSKIIVIGIQRKENGYAFKNFNSAALDINVISSNLTGEMIRQVVCYNYNCRV